MNEEKKLEEIKKEDSKKKPIFFIVLVVLCVFGGFFGYFMASQEEKLDVFMGFFRDNTQILSIFFSMLLIITGLVFSISFIIRFKSVKKIWANVEERDDNWDIIERKLSSLATFINFAIINLFFLYGCSVYNIRGNLRRLDDGIRILNILYDVFFVATILFMFVYNFVFFYMQKKIVDFEKIMNPEKKGSLYDFGFGKKWYEGFDEAERKQVGIASYKAFVIVSKTCIGMIAVLIFLGMIADITIIPLLCVCALWAVQVIAFGIESKRVIGKLL
ncbi:MAG: DUF3169 family protein [Lachnospiraceae bacterium]|nr:DUF3169 family protein [Lachnospiraceae bacterium]